MASARSRIALIHSRFRSPLGGTELYTLRLARSLLERGRDVAIATGSADGRALRELDGAQVFLLPVANIYEPGSGTPSLPIRSIWHALDVFNPSVLPWIRRTLDVFRPDVVHTQNFQGLSGALFAGIRPFPHVHTAHDSSLLHPRTVVRPDARRLSLPLRSRARFLARRLTRSTIVFPDARQLELHRRFGWSPSVPQSVVVPHGWALDWQPRRRRSSGSRAVRFLFAGRLSEQKGIPTLLHAWGERGIDGAELWVAGDGPERACVEAAARRLSSLSYLGWLVGEEKQRIFDDADVLLFPSRTPEGFGLGCAEAILCGTPVVTSEIARPAFIRGDENGAVVTGGPGAWRDVMARLAADRTFVARLANGARLTARELDWEAHVDRLEALYEEVRAA
jgi:glycosyltransferase involved in cell wall biosynthesis